MRRSIQTFAVAGIVALLSLGAAPAFPQQTPAVYAQQGSCQFGPVFQVLRDMVGKDRVGECTGPLIRNEAGDVNQPTTRGIMTLRTADQVAAFSDGQTTWLIGPNGLESRASGSRLSWEGTAASSGTGTGSGGTSSSVASAATPSPTPAMATPTPYSQTAIPYGQTPTPTPTQYSVPGLAYVPSGSGYNQGQTSYTETGTTLTPTSSGYGQSQATYGQPPTPTVTWQTQTAYGQSPPTNGQVPGAYAQSQLPGERTGSNQLPQPPVGLSVQPSPTPTAPVVEALPISFDGNGGSSSKAFDLTGGSYVVSWQASQRDKDACYVGARLRHVDDPNPGNLIMHTTLGSTKDRSISSETRLTSVAPGRYVIDVMTTGCSWKLTLREP